MAHVSLGVVHRSLRRPPTALSGLCRLSRLVWSVLILDRTLAPTTLYTLCVALTPHERAVHMAVQLYVVSMYTCLPRAPMHAPGGDLLSLAILRFKGREEEDCPVRVGTSVRLHAESKF
jgi:hypothetical protein